MSCKIINKKQILMLYLLNYCCSSGWIPEIWVKAGLTSFLCFLLSFFFALFVLPRILLISQKKHLFDSQDTRKCHTGKVPRLGGLIFVPAILCTMSLATAFRYIINFPLNPLWAERTLMEFLFLISGICFLYLVGAKDDLVGVRYRKKFIAQFVVAVLIPCSGLYVNQLYGLFGIYTIPPWIGIPLTMILIVYITNAINLIDGIDGLAAAGCSISFFMFGILFAERGLYVYSMLSFTVLGSLLPFAYYNIFGQVEKGSKMFMGDTGALTLGYLLAIMAIKYAMYTPDYYIPYNVSSLIFPLSVLFIPCIDALRVMLVRAYHHRPLFLADRNHIHHKCLETGMNHLQATIFLMLLALAVMLINLCLINYLNISVLVMLDIIFFLLIIYWLEKNQKV